MKRAASTSASSATTSSSPLSSASSLSSTSSSSDESINLIKCSACHEHGDELLKRTLPVNVDRLFHKLFSHSDFMSDFFKSKHYFNVISTNWIKGPDLTRLKTISYYVKSHGATKLKITNYHILRKCSVPNQLYSVDVISTTTGTTYDDCFEIHLHYCLRKRKRYETSLIVLGHLIFTKNIWSVSKRIIENYIVNGLKEYYKELDQKLVIKFQKLKKIKQSRGTSCCLLKRRKDSSINNCKLDNKSELNYNNDRDDDNFYKIQAAEDNCEYGHHRKSTVYGTKKYSVRASQNVRIIEVNENYSDNNGNGSGKKLAKFTICLSVLIIVGFTLHYYYN